MLNQCIVRTLLDEIKYKLANTIRLDLFIVSATKISTLRLIERVVPTNSKVKLVWVSCQVLID